MTPFTGHALTDALIAALCGAGAFMAVMAALGFPKPTDTGDTEL